jgi:ABC-type nitrate/sulfonate/bicarbonate transport system substrate-binding protein
MTRRNLAGLSLVAAALAAVPAVAKEKITFAYLLDPIYESFMYPIKEGIIKSDLIEIVPSAISVPAAIQAMATKQYDVITTSAFSVPKGIDQGLKTTILSVAVRYRKDGRGSDIWVKKDSAYKTIADLKGKSIAISSASAANTTLTRLVLSKKYGMNVKLEGGDLQWLEIPTGAQAAALATGKIDSAIFLHIQAIRALQGGEFRPILSAAEDFYQLTGTEAVTAVQIGYPERIAAKPEAYAEFNRMVKASRDYTLANIDQVAKGVAGDKMPATFLKEWLELIGDFPAVVTEDDVKSIRLNWEASKELGLLNGVPDMKEVIWSRAPRS